MAGTPFRRSAETGGIGRNASPSRHAYVLTIALVYGHAATAFNGLYYATMATVIPVLFLAVAVQGRTYDDLVRGIARISTRDPLTPSNRGLSAPACQTRYSRCRACVNAAVVQ